MTLIARAADFLLDLPSRSDILFRVARRIVNRHQGENDWRMDHNGETRLLREMLPRADVVFDVGANVGEWARHALAINPAIELHCFEPCRGTFNQLQASVRNAKVNNVGVGAEPGMIDLFVYGDVGPTNSMHQRTGVGLTPLRTEQVPVISLDDYAVDIAMIDFVKIDVEGHELAVLKGARKLLSERRIGALQFEYSGCFIDSRTLLRDIWELLEPNYRIHKILSHKLALIEKYDQKMENFQYANFVAIGR